MSAGKGSLPRPFSVDWKTYSDNWNRAFRRSESIKESEPEKVKEPELPEKAECLECGEDATWIRVTQFAGNHPFCTKHAKLEKGFKKQDSTFFWRKIK